MGLKSHLMKRINGEQIKALLWKDVLIRCRQPVSLTPPIRFDRNSNANRRQKQISNFRVDFGSSGWRQFNTFGHVWYSSLCMRSVWNSKPNRYPTANFLRVSYLVQPACCHFSSPTFARSKMSAGTSQRTMKSVNLRNLRESFANSILCFCLYFHLIFCIDFRITPIVHFVQTFLNEDALYNAIHDLPVKHNFLGAIQAIAGNPKFPLLQGSIFLWQICRRDCLNIQWRFVFIPFQHTLEN